MRRGDAESVVVAAALLLNATRTTGLTRTLPVVVRALAGMGPAMPAVLGSDTPTLTLDTAAGGHVKVRYARP